MTSFDLEFRHLNLEVNRIFIQINWGQVHSIRTFMEMIKDSLVSWLQDSIEFDLSKIGSDLHEAI